MTGTGPALSDALLEAWRIAAGIVSMAEPKHSPALGPLVLVFGQAGLIPQGVTPTELGRDIRDHAGDRAAWLKSPSTMLEALAAHDTRTGSTLAATYEAEAVELARTVAALIHRREQGAYAADVFQATLTRRLRPAAGSKTGTPETLESILADLDALVGLAPVKAAVRALAARQQVRRLKADRGLLTVAGESNHLIMAGNPGTGKTTVARLLGRIYKALDVLPSGHLVEVDRAGLVAGYQGQTALKVEEAFDRADGGLLLIDEAYALVRDERDTFGHEALDTVVKLVEDRRDRLVVVLTGYPAEMARLVSANPGTESRFPRTLLFPDYADDELVDVLLGLADAAGMMVPAETAAAARTVFESVPRGRGFGNARVARNVFEAAEAAQSVRLLGVADPTDTDLMTLLPGDVAPEPALTAA